MTLERSLILKKVRQIDDLPAFPEVVTELEREFANPNVSFKRVAKIVEYDPSLSARFLKVANSVFYKGVKEVSNISDAVIRLGLAEVKKIALAIAVVQRYGQFGGKSPQQFWQHCITVAMSTKVIMEMSTADFDEEEKATAFSGGLLHDIGYLALFLQFPTESAELSLKVQEEGGSMWEEELTQWGISHAEVGLELAKLWKLPDNLQQVIGYHHQPWKADEEHRVLAQIVHLANFICNNQGFSRVEEGFPDSFDHSSWEALGMNIDDVPEIIAKTLEEGNSSNSFMQLV